MIRDRGMKKWQGMMLPEHVRLLRDRRENLTKVRRPELDEQQLELIQGILENLLANDKEAHFKLWVNGSFETYRGTVTKIDEYKQQIHYYDPFRNPCKPLNIDQIVDITLPI